jgi:hypothetical protein
MPDDDKKEKRWTVTRCIEEAAKLGINMTRPTVIRMCETQDIGYQPTGKWGAWAVHPDRFKALIKGEAKAKP